MGPRFSPSIILAGTVGAVLLATPDVHACSQCPENVSTIEERLANSDAVFRGTVIAEDVPEGGNVTLVLEVHEVWKGVHTHEIELDTGGSGAHSCWPGDYYEVGQELLVFAYRPEPYYQLNQGTPVRIQRKLSFGPCDSPTRIEHTGPALESLGPGKPPSGEPPPEPPSEPERMGIFPLTLIGVAGFVAVALVLVLALVGRTRTKRS
jgi:hypothetical protein